MTLPVKAIGEREDMERVIHRIRPKYSAAIIVHSPCIPDNIFILGTRISS